MCLDNRPDPFIGGLFPLVPYSEFKARLKEEAKQKRLQQQQQQINSSYMSHLDSSFTHTPVRRRKISEHLANKIQSAVPMESPGQPRKYEEADTSSVLDVINNSDEDNQALSMQDADSGVDQEINNADGEIVHSSPKRDVNDHRVLRSISTNSQHLPVQLTKTTTTTTTRTISTTLTSNPTSPSGSKMLKSRSSTKVHSALLPGKNGTRIHSGGIRKLSGKKY